MKWAIDLRAFLLIAVILIFISMGLLQRWRQFEILGIGVPVFVIILFLVGGYQIGAPFLKWMAITLIRFSIFMTIYLALLFILGRFTDEGDVAVYTVFFFMILSWIVSLILMAFLKFKL